MDETTTGLSFKDCAALLRVLHHLVDQDQLGPAHRAQPGLIKNADWMIELGPGVGDQDSNLLACGTPELLDQSIGIIYTGYATG